MCVAKKCGKLTDGETRKAADGCVKGGKRSPLKIQNQSAPGRKNVTAHIESFHSPSPSFKLSPLEKGIAREQRVFETFHSISGRDRGPRSGTRQTFLSNVKRDEVRALNRRTPRQTLHLTAEFRRPATLCLGSNYLWKRQKLDEGSVSFSTRIVARYTIYFSSMIVTWNGLLVPFLRTRQKGLFRCVESFVTSR